MTADHKWQLGVIDVSHETDAESDDIEFLRSWHALGSRVRRTREEMSLERLQVHPKSSLNKDHIALEPRGAVLPVTLMMQSALDHLQAAATVVEHGQLIPTFALFTLARGAIENAATAYWLLAASNRDERLTRYLRYYKDDRKKNKTARESLRKAKGDLEPLSQEASGESDDPVELIAEKNGITLTNAPRLTSTEIIGKTGDSLQLPYLLWEWQMCSGHAHGRPWAPINTNRLTPLAEREGDDWHRMNAKIEMTLLPNQSAFEVSLAALELFDKRRSPH